MFSLSPSATMARFLAFTLLLLFALPVFAQPFMPPPRDDETALMLRQMQSELTAQLQETQRMLSLVGPNDRQLANMLQTRQEDLTRQLRDVVQQRNEMTGGMQGRGGRDEIIPNPAMPAEMPPGMMGGIQPGLEMPPGMMGGMGGMPPNVMGGMGGMRMQPGLEMPPRGMGGMVEQPPSWDTTPWGPRMPRELIEIRQSVDLLKREVGELKETIKALEAQIHLLNRNILLFDRVRDLEEPY